MPLGAIWVDGSFYFTSSAGTRKSRDIAHNPNCVITVATHDFDLVVEGEAVKLTDHALAQRIAEIYRAQGWPVTVIAGTASLTADYSAPSAGPPPWDVYQVTPQSVYALGTAEPYGATKFRF
jgi:hypothetical protein